LFAIAQKNVRLHRKMCDCTEKCAINQDTVYALIVGNAPLEIFSKTSSPCNLLIKKARYYFINSMPHSGIHLALMAQQKSFATTDIEYLQRYFIRL
jgi:hypothetical protein